MKPTSDLIDTARGSLILLVVWGHLLESNGFNGNLYFAIYIFHIPAFAMISGMLSKSSLNAEDVLRICKRLLLPFVVFQGAYVLMLEYFAPDRVGSIYEPVWIVWFLVSLMTWKLVLPLVLRLPYPLTLSVIAALLVGSIDIVGSEFSISRTFVFFPAFLFGHLHGNRIVEAVTRHRVPLGALFAAIFCTALLVSDNFDIRWLWGSHPYSGTPFATPGIVFRAAFITIGIIASVAFIAVVPSTSRLLSFLGQKTMPVYLLHGFPVILFWAGGFQLGGGFLFLLLTAVFSLAISVSIARISTLLSSRSINET